MKPAIEEMVERGFDAADVDLGQQICSWKVSVFWCLRPLRRSADPPGSLDLLVSTQRLRAGLFLCRRFAAGYLVICRAAKWKWLKRIRI